MDVLLLLLTIGLPIMKLVLFPAKTIGRGGSWVIVGAVMIVGMMMVLWFAVQSASNGGSGDDLSNSPDVTKAAQVEAAQIPDLATLARQLQQ